MCKIKVRAAMNFLRTSKSCEVTEMEPGNSFLGFFVCFKDHPPSPQIEPDGDLGLSSFCIQMYCRHSRSET